MTLNDLRSGEKGIIVKVRGRGAFRNRITDMGFIKGTQVEVIKSAPMKDPVEYRLMGYNITLRRSEAKNIEVIRPGEIACVMDNAPRQFGRGWGFKRRNRRGCRCPRRGAESVFSEVEEKVRTIDAVLVGNPNCGKTTFYNAASGSNERVGNYSGVTVEARSSKINVGGYTINIVDLPGTYSLAEYSPEELFVREYIINNSPDVVINIIDASNLERNLYLTTQLIDLDVRVVSALNMYDELEAKGDSLDYKTLGEMLGVPFVPTVSSKGKGIDGLFKKVIEVYEDRDTTARHIHINYGHDIENAIAKVQTKINKDENYNLSDEISTRYISLKLLEKDEKTRFLIFKRCANAGEILETADAGIKKIEEHLSEDTETLIADARYAFVRGALMETYTYAKKPGVTLSEKIDSVLTHWLFGIPIFLAFMWLIFQVTFVIGEYPKSWLERAISASGSALSALMGPGFMRDLVVDGVISGVGGVLVFLPNILILFFMISLMEDTGYMARAAFIMDKAMHRIGLHGKSFIPLLMGFGCNVPAIMATRTIESKTDRLLTMMIIPFMSCSARLPVYVLLISAFFPEHPGTMLFAVYITGALAGVFTAMILKRTVFKKSEFPFVMELPPYRSLHIKATSRHMWDRAVEYLKKIAGTILIASLIIWLLGRAPAGNYLKDGAPDFTKQVKLEDSVLARVGYFIEPALAPLGFDWNVSLSLLSGLAAKELIVSTMTVIYNVESREKGESDKLVDELKNMKYTSGPRQGEKVFTKPTALGFIFFVLLYFPCVGSISAIRRESGSWKWPLIAALYTTSLAWVAAFFVRQIGSIFI